MAEGRQKTYLCIDLKSFYASVECVDRGLDPLTTNLVVADKTRGRTTICLAITPAMKRLGIRNRCRLFEIPKSVKYITARPRMRTYMERSADIYSIYLRFVSPEDVHVYSIDECFIDATPYLRLYGMDNARELACRLRDAVLAETGITATAGVGSNLFQAKVALDVTAKHAPDGIGELDDETFREKIWHHRPITDIWNIGPGIARRLAKRGIHDLAGVALTDPTILRREFGVNAEYLIDHAWGQESCTIGQIRAYQPMAHSLSNGQILPEDYTFDDARIVLKEMVDALVLELVEQRLVTSSISLTVGYAKARDAPADAKANASARGGRSSTQESGRARGGRPRVQATNRRDGEAIAPQTGIYARWEGSTDSMRPGQEGPAMNRSPEVESHTTDRQLDNRIAFPEKRTSSEEGEVFVGEHGARPAHRFGPHTGGGRKLACRTNSCHELTAAMDSLYVETTARNTPIRRLMIGFGDLVDEELTTVDLFTDIDALYRERDLGHAVLAVKERFGKNALLKGLSLTEKATARERNMQVGGHRA